MKIMLSCQQTETYTRDETNLDR